MFYEFRSGCRPAININYFSKFNTYEFSFFTSFSVIPAVTIVKVGGRSYSLIYRVTCRGGATVLKVGGTKRDPRAKRAKKKIFVPPTFGKVGGTIFLHVGYEQGNIKYTEICCLVVALIHIS